MRDAIFLYDCICDYHHLHISEFGFIPTANDDEVTVVKGLVKNLVNSDVDDVAEVMNND